MDSTPTKPIFPRLSSGPRKMEPGVGGAQPARQAAGRDGRGGLASRLPRHHAARAGRARRGLEEHLLRTLREQAGLLPLDLRRHHPRGRAADGRGLRPAQRPAREDRGGHHHAFHGQRGAAGRGIAGRGRLADAGSRRGAPPRAGRGAFRSPAPARLRRIALLPPGLGPDREGHRRRSPQHRLPPFPRGPGRGAARGGRRDRRLDRPLRRPGGQGGAAPRPRPPPAPRRGRRRPRSPTPIPRTAANGSPARRPASPSRVATRG